MYEEARNQEAKKKERAELLLQKEREKLDKERAKNRSDIEKTNEMVIRRFRKQFMETIGRMSEEEEWDESQLVSFH